MTRSLLAALLFALTLTVAGLPPASASGHIIGITYSIQDPDDPWSGDWSDEALGQIWEPLVEAYLEGGPKAGATALKAAMDKAGEDHAERATIAYAYAIGLITAGEDYADARPAMEMAVSEGRLGFPRGRRLAMILSDAASVEFEALREGTSSLAEMRAQEAWDMRLERLGPHQPETLASVMILAQIRGQPERVMDDAEAIAAVDALYRLLLAADPPTREDDDLTHWFVSWGRFHARIGQPQKACAVVDALIENAARLKLDPAFGGRQIANTLREQGHVRYAAPWFTRETQPRLEADKPIRCAVV